MKKYFYCLLAGLALAFSSCEEVDDIPMAESWGEYYPPYHEVEMVDLGLSVAWAAENCCMPSDSEYAWFFAWGETEIKDTYLWSNYLYGNMDALDKYNSQDGLLALETENDVVFQASQAELRLPTPEEVQELIDQCTWTCEGNYYRVTGSNGESITLFMNGFMGANLMNAGNIAYYLTNALDAKDCTKAQLLRLTPDAYQLVSNYRCYGYLARGVKPLNTR